MSIITDVFFYFKHVDLILNIFKEKTCGLRNTRLDKCLKSLILEESSTSNIVNGGKHC